MVSDHVSNVKCGSADKLRDKRAGSLRSIEDRIPGRGRSRHASIEARLKAYRPGSFDKNYEHRFVTRIGLGPWEALYNGPEKTAILE
jgi:hypothetical protein